MSKDSQSPQKLIVPDSFVKQKKVDNFDDYIRAHKELKEGIGEYEKYDKINIRIIEVYKTFFERCMKEGYYVLPDFHLICAFIELDILKIEENRESQLLKKKLNDNFETGYKFFETYQEFFEKVISRTEIDIKKTEEKLIKLLKDSSIQEQLHDMDKEAIPVINKLENFNDIFDLPQEQKRYILRIVSELYKQQFFPTLMSSVQMLLEVQMVAAGYEKKTIH